MNDLSHWKFYFKIWKRSYCTDSFPSKNYPWIIKIWKFLKNWYKSITEKNSIASIMVKINLQIIKNLCVEKETFDCAGIPAQVFRLPVDWSNQLSYTGVRQPFHHRKTSLYCVSANKYPPFDKSQQHNSLPTGIMLEGWVCDVLKNVVTFDMSSTIEVPFCWDIGIFFMSLEISKATFILEMLDQHHQWNSTFSLA